VAAVAVKPLGSTIKDSANDSTDNGMKKGRDFGLLPRRGLFPSEQHE